MIYLSFSSITPSLFLSTKCMEAQYNIILQSPPNAKRTNFTPQVGDSAILCSPYIYSLPDGEKITEGEDGIAVSFGMPVVISKIVNDWCRINSIFNAHIGYVPVSYTHLTLPTNSRV